MNVASVHWSDQKLYFTSDIQARCFCPQAIAHYEQAADYYKGEESNRQVIFIRSHNREGLEMGSCPRWPTCLHTLPAILF